MSASKAWLSVCVLVALLASTVCAVNIETVSVGNPGNAPDMRYGTPGYGAVSYTYQMGKYEVTAGQYTEFLNAVADADTYGLYNLYMDYDADPSWKGCNIKRQGLPGGYTYSVAADWANRPVNLVSWGDAARFANWLTNGQPTGPQGLSTTEDGSYYLNGATSSAALLAVTRKANARFVIPTEDEWYKAAYHKNDGVTGNYWSYATGTSTTPSNDLVDPDPGNNATFNDGSYTIGSPYYRTEVGSFENSESPYGTFDQDGNLWEWNEAIVDVTNRGQRGGCFGNSEVSLRASSRSFGYPALQGHFGFRVAYVPEPATLSLLILGGLAVMRRRRSIR